MSVVEYDHDLAWGSGCLKRSLFHPKIQDFFSVESPQPEGPDFGKIGASPCHGKWL